MTPLEDKLYLALMGARTIVAATANVNPAAHKILRLVDDAVKAYQAVRPPEEPATEEEADAAGN